MGDYSTIADARREVRRRLDLPLDRDGDTFTLDELYRLREAVEVDPNARLRTRRSAALADIVEAVYPEPPSTTPEQTLRRSDVDAFLSVTNDGLPSEGANEEGALTVTPDDLGPGGAFGSLLVDRVVEDGLTRVAAFTRHGRIREPLDSDDVEGEYFYDHSNDRVVVFEREGEAGSYRLRLADSPSNVLARGAPGPLAENNRIDLLERVDTGLTAASPLGQGDEEGDS